MAITLQLARLDSDLLKRVCAERAVWNDLVSFKLLPKTKHLDLNWAEPLLLTLARLANQPALSQAALYLGANGNFPIRIDDSLHEIDQPTFGINRDQVVQIAKGLEKLDVESMLAAIPSNPIDWNRLMQSDLLADARVGYIDKHLQALIAFYRDAAAAGEAVVVWSD